ncbi:homocysteine biosynthesis protein [Desulfofundulus thermocisternus]|uniref:homocysteine biosynthesis protein n=1 Tax=Desulfofundulus thermocisternus TaxID=42471 RepID=UPI0019F439CF|nr:homocysteine biosynthesis protein [Desulfofundulus thermocisternus]MBE3585751.1 homocysteine biosynthesis protein [Thermoanaerobacter sp.]MCS5696319.1 homocysteine biosynthesis protein [Desulfofundulus thermocisternus]
MSEKTYQEINARIKSGKAVVVTAEEFIDIVREKGLTRASQEVDVVTTGTFAPMCSSGAFLNFGHPAPRIKMHRVWLNNVPAYTGIAAVDAYIGATELPEDDPLNSNHPGEFRYGGGHVIEDLVAGRPVRLKATAYGTDCYPRREIETTITIHDINEAILFNPRNAYQNYNCAVNLSNRTIYTYMGILKPNLGNAHYSTSGQLSPLLKDPHFKTIGIGTRIFLGGGIGYVAWHGTQHFPAIQTDPDSGRELGPAGGTLAVIGDLKQMSPRWLMGTSYLGYGATLSVGIGVPIPILNEEIARYAAASDAELYAPIVDYGEAYPNRKPGNLGYVSYAQLKSGKIVVQGKEVPTAPLSSYPRAREIAGILKKWIQNGEFYLAEPVQLLPSPADGLTGKVLKG